MKRKVVWALSVLAFASPAWAIPLGIQPGFWEITTRMEIPGVPIEMPSHKLRRCYTKKDVEDLMRPGARQIQDCEIRDQKVDGNRVTWKMECRGEGAMSGTGAVTVHPTSFRGTIKGSMKQGRATLEMTQAVSGRRIGDCT